MKSWMSENIFNKDLPSKQNEFQYISEFGAAVIDGSIFSLLIVAFLMFRSVDDNYTILMIQNIIWQHLK